MNLHFRGGLMLLVFLAVGFWVNLKRRSDVLLRGKLYMIWIIKTGAQLQVNIWIGRSGICWIGSDPNLLVDIGFQSIGTGWNQQARRSFEGCTPQPNPVMNVRCGFLMVPLHVHQPIARSMVVSQDWYCFRQVVRHIIRVRLKFRGVNNAGNNKNYDGKAECSQ